MFDYLKKSKDYEKMYVELIDKTNDLQEDYIEIKKRNLKASHGNSWNRQGVFWQIVFKTVAPV